MIMHMLKSPSRKIEPYVRGYKEQLQKQGKGEQLDFQGMHPQVSSSLKS